jgi:pimeloyl-ACP methyl ester carboxylesterase
MADTRAQTSYASVNGLEMYYEIHGSGEPLVLLPGAFMTIDAFGSLIPALAESRQIIAVELQGHGHTADIDRPLRFERMADDVAALIAYLGHAQVDLFGYSLGGGVALQTAIRHPDTIRKLVVASATFKHDGWYPETLAGMAAVNAELAKQWVESPMYEAYARVAPRPDDWPTVADKVGQLLRQDYDWSEGVAALATPTLIAIGDADGVRPMHAVEMFALLGGGKADVGIGGDLPHSQLAVLPGTTHFSILTRTDLLRSIIMPFLDAPTPAER